MPLPSDYNTVPVTGKFVYLDGTPASGIIRFTGKIAAISASSDTVILPNTITVNLEPDGSFLVNLPATDDPDILPNGWTYSVEERFNAGGGRKYEIDVPVGSSGIDISDIAPVTPANGDPTAFVTLSAFTDHTHPPLLAPRTWLRNLPSETVISNFQAGHGWTKASASGTMVDDTTTYARGTSSVKLTTPNSASSVFMDLTGTWDLSNRQIKLYVKTDDYSKLNELWVYFGDTALTNYYRFNLTYDARTLRTGDWCVVTMNPISANVVGTPSWSTIQKIRIRATDKATGAVNVWLGGLSHFATPSQGIISITFDDSYVSDYTHARPLMDAYGFRGTSYTIKDYIGTSGRLSLDQAQRLQNLHGWDISCHGSPDMTTLTADQLHAEFRGVKEFLYDNGLTKGVDHYALPMGRYNSQVQSIAKEYFASVRTIDEFYETTIPGDPHRLRILNVTNTTTTARVAQAAQDAANGKCWLILVYHQIVDSNADVDTKVLTSNFQQNMADINAAGVPVKTISEVISGL
jgi:hypothetical protein